MFAAAVAKLTNSIFPIYRETPVPPQSFEIHVVGSGFFVDAHGTFVTVAHVLDGASPVAQFQYRGRSPDHFENPLLPITCLARDDEKDILIGHVDAQLTHGLDLLEAPVSNGTSVCVAGYPLAQLTMQAGALDVGKVRRYFQNAMVVDRCSLPVWTRRHDGFMMTEFSLFGMSGGPVVTRDGTVVGMQASITDPRVSEGAGGRRITIENAVAIGSEHIHVLLTQVMTEQEQDARARA
jgi:S1-C subfamily serine protease